MGTFINQLDANLLTGVIVFIVIGAPTFGYFFNRLMDSLKGEHEHTSLYVAIGVAVTLTFGALISWKASILLLSIFCLTGLPMMIGEFLRTEKKRKTPRRKRLPYAANGILDEIAMANTEAQRLMNKASEAETKEEIYKHMIRALNELNTIGNRVSEVKRIQEK